ncbi:MAG TPA: alanine racemase [Candidatus Mcinerneyibacteriales bacterium]|nr:alanine racemase [Candidatus Mcinerneyibacteriales bacterium]HPJ70026.1 alanine racemase [Candidatus Mcinerneyibacteriales bacterium]HPQ88547.1 alanine racemase [Candidatus Mcinerneyibacteriales bacterium]
MTVLEDRSAERLAQWMKENKKLKTPFYYYDEEIIRHQARRLKDILPPNGEIFYSVKANPNLHIVRTLADEGCGMEIASSGELKLCLRAGISPDKIIYAGPAKRNDELEEALLSGVGAVNVESAVELERLAVLCRRYEKKQKIHLRINPPFDVGGNGIKMGGGAQKFGIDSERLSDIKALLDKNPLIQCVGFHVFAATQLLDGQKLLIYFKRAITLMKESGVKLGIELLHLDIGSGLGISYGPEESGLDDDSLTKGMKELFNDEGIETRKVLIETGRFLVGQSAFFVTRVIDKKISRGVVYLLCDGGIHHMLRPVLIGDNHEIFLLGTKEIERPKECVTIAGPLCTSVDVLGIDVELERAEIGDILCVAQAGAYGYTESMPFFLSHPVPDEYMRDLNGRVRKIRKGLGYEIILQLQEEAEDE